MITTDNFELDIVDIGTSGQGIGKLDGFVYFVPHTAPGDKIIAKAVEFHKNYALAQAVEIKTPSRLRVTPKCKYFAQCNGCQLQHIEYDEQLRYKTEFVKATLNKQLEQNIEVMPCISSKKAYNYRNKINFCIHDNKLCYDANQPIAIDDCPLFCQDARQLIWSINKYLASAPHNFSHVHIRKLDNFQITFVSETFDFPNSDTLISDLLSKNIEFSMYVSKNTIKNSSNITPCLKQIWGKQSNFVYQDIQAPVSPDAFLQINLDVQNLAYELICENISKNCNIINAYGGTGILSAHLSKHCSQVFSVEINKNASLDCEKLCKTNKINNVVSICDDCKNAIPYLVESNNIDTIIFDPPRKGIDKSIIDCVISSKINKIIYLSCNPATLARDIKLLRPSYAPTLVQPLDMFPQTCHVETLVVFQRC